MIKKIIWPILIAFLALFLRIHLAVNGPFEYDESPYFESAVLYNQAMRSNHWDLIFNSENNIEHPQFNKLVYAAGLMAFGPMKEIIPIHFGQPLKSVPYWPKLVGLRMISVFFGTATVFVLSLINPMAGLFLAVDTIEIKYSSVIYLEALPQFLCLLSMVSALKALNVYQASDRGYRWVWLRWLLLSAFAMGISLASKYMYGSTMIAIGIAVLGQGWKQRGSIMVGMTLWGILTAVFFVLFDPVLWIGPVNRLWELLQFNINYSNSQYVSDISYPFWQPIYWLLLSIPQHSELNSPFFMNKADFVILADSLIFIFALIGLPALFKKNMPLFCWLMIGMIFLLFWRTKWPQYVMLVLPAFCLSASYGFEFIRSFLPGGKSSILERFERHVQNDKII